MDITAILLCVEELIWSVCNSVEELIRPCQASGNWVSCIHRLCNQLFNVCVILTAPLPQLYRYWKYWRATSTSVNKTCHWCYDSAKSVNDQFWWFIEPRWNSTIWFFQFTREILNEKGQIYYYLRYWSEWSCRLVSPHISEASNLQSKFRVSVLWVEWSLKSFRCKLYSWGQISSLKSLKSLRL